MEKQHSTRLLWLVATVWFLNIVAGMIPPLDYEPDGAINGVFTCIASLVFVADKVGNKKPTEDNKPEEEVK